MDESFDKIYAYPQIIINNIILYLIYGSSIIIQSIILSFNNLHFLLLLCKTAPWEFLSWTSYINKRNSCAENTDAKRFLSIIHVANRLTIKIRFVGDKSDLCRCVRHQRTRCPCYLPFYLFKRRTLGGRRIRPYRSNQWVPRWRRARTPRSTQNHDKTRRTYAHANVRARRNNAESVFNRSLL